jgi:hypothetical protein
MNDPGMIHHARFTAVIILLLTFGAAAGVAQTLTSTFQFTASGYIGTAATVNTPFQGYTFTDAAITVTEIAFTAMIRCAVVGVACALTILRSHEVDLRRSGRG